MTESKEDTLVMGHYIVAFVDVLGQQEKLRNLKKLPQNDEEQKEFYALIRGTYGSVSQMQESFTRFFSSFSDVEINKFELTPDQNVIIQQLRNNEIRFQRFSDCIVIYSSLRDDENKIPLRAVFGVLAATAATFLQCFATGIPIRAGIDVGLGMEVNEGEFYGPALSRAYTLESRVATYPRAVVGEELVNYLHLNASYNSDDIYKQANKAAADMCINLLVNDADGYAIVDYLGDGYKNQVSKNLHEEIAKKAYQKIIELSEKQYDDKNSKVAFYYKLLRHYFESRQAEFAQEVMKKIDTGHSEA